MVFYLVFCNRFNHLSFGTDVDRFLTLFSFSYFAIDGISVVCFAFLCVSRLRRMYSACKKKLSLFIILFSCDFIQL